MTTDKKIQAATEQGPQISSGKKELPYVIKKERKFVFIAILTVTLFGLLMIYESSSMYAFKMMSDPAYFFKKQLLSFFIGLVLFSLILPFRSPLFCCAKL